MNIKHAILVEAKKRLDREKYLCYAILSVSYNYDKDDETIEDLCNIISNSLGRWNFAESWLHNDVGIPVSQLTAKNMLAYRHRWIDSLTEEYK